MWKNDKGEFSPELEYIAVVVVYNPTEEHVRNIRRIHAQLKNTVVVDNSPKKRLKLPDITVIYPEENLGVAGGANIGLKICREKKYRGVFIFDQDTLIPENYILSMINFKNSLRDSKVLIFAPAFMDRNTGSYGSFFSLSKISVKKLKTDKDVIFPSFVITSGMLIDCKAIDIVGFFDEYYFLDQVDTEYCLRVLKHGYRIAVNRNIVIEHSIGDREKKRFLFLNIKPNKHNSFRKYLIFRNGIITIKRYFKTFPSIFIWEGMIFSHELLSILFFENNKKEKIKAVLKGIKDGLFF